MSDTSPARLHAPELRGRGWLNTGGRELRLADLRGRIVLLDFWTFCCVNCLHVLDELRPLEREFADQVVVVGVHSPKFAHEADPDALAAAVERYGVHHAVLDDPELLTWQAYTARAWPTLVVVDPEGRIVASMSGEGHAHGLRVLLRELVEQHRASGTLHEGDGPYVAPPAPDTALRFPGKAVVLPDGDVVVSDTAHGQLVRLAPDLTTERWRIGGMTEPQGLCLLPEQVRRRVGHDLLVADAAGHRIWSVRLADQRLAVAAGTGAQLRERSGGGAALGQDLSTPWDVVWWQDRAVIAMAGTHQLWGLHLGADPADSTLHVLAGTSAEGVKDGPAYDAWFAQPSGLAVSGDGERVWVADSETSALRSIALRDGAFEVETHVGEGLFDFGHVDGERAEARMQHPLGVCALPDGSVAVADTYNGAIRRFDPGAGELTTLATGLAEPSDVVVADDGTTLLVVESAAHRLVRLAVPDDARRVHGLDARTRRPPTALAAGEVTLRVRFAPPAGQKLDDRWGDPTQLMVSATPDTLLRDGAGTAQGLTRRLHLDPAVGDGVLHVSVRAAACDEGADGAVPEGAACHLYQQDWGIPVRLTADGPDELDLDLRGV